MKFLGKWLALGTALVVSVVWLPGARAGESSRGADFSLNVSQETRGNTHGGAVPKIGATWTYFLVRDYHRFANEKGVVDYGKLLKSENLEPLECNTGCVFQQERAVENRLRYDYKASANGVLLYWDTYPGGHHNPLGDGAVVMSCTVPKTGEYSLRGQLRCLCDKPAENAALAIGVMTGKCFVPLFSAPLGKETGPEDTPLSKALEQEPALQQLNLAAGDQIVFVVGSSRKNDVRLELIDRDVRLVSEALPAPVLVSAKTLALSKLDFSRPELAEVKASLDAGDEGKAFDQYKALLAKRVAALSPAGKFDYWLFHPANADELLNGVLSTGHYGISGTTTYSIGKPGAVDWFKMPEDGYEPAVRDIATMHWTNRLAEAYSQTGERRYLDAYLAYWSDFAKNWYACYQENCRRDPKFTDRIKGSITWAPNSRLYNAWRLETLNAGLDFIFRRALADNALDAIDSEALAAIFNHLYFWETPRSMHFLRNSQSGLPNQQQLLAATMFTTGVILNDVKGAGAWRTAAVDNILNVTGYLADGTDMEQSFNYNKGLHEKLAHFLRLAPALPPAQRGWVPKMEEMDRYRFNFMDAIVMPMTGQPICGKNNTWDGGDYKKPQAFLPGISDHKIKDFGKFPLCNLIRDRFYGEKTLPEPAFRSVYFPYGGYYALRGDWTPEALYSFMKVSRPAPGHMLEDNNAPIFAAYGRQLLVNSGAHPYNPQSKIHDYAESSLSQNTIAVDGYGQQLRFEAELPIRYADPLKYRFLDGDCFSFAEGLYDRPYGGWNGQDPALTGKKVIRDVRHTRQVILLRREKLWIVTDVVRSEEEHRFTQVWNFPPDFKENEVTINDGIILTNHPGSANIALYPFAGESLDYEKYCGLDAHGQTLGWVAMENPQTGLDASPKVDVHGSWKGKGEKVVITVLVPFTTENPVKAVAPQDEGGARGVDITLVSGERIQYRYHSEGATEAELQTREAKLTLQPGGGYEKTADGKRNPIIVPTGFHWHVAQGSEVPVYAPEH